MEWRPVADLSLWIVCGCHETQVTAGCGDLPLCSYQGSAHLVSECSEQRSELELELRT